MNTNRFIRWVRDNFFILLLAVYSLLYARWFIVLPVDDYKWDSGTFAFGLKLLIFSTITSILWRVFVHHNKIRSVFATTAFVSFLLTGLYIYAYMPHLEEVASFNGNVYFLTYHHESTESSYNPLLTKWDSKFHHSISGLGETCCTLKLTYDPLTHLVSVVQIGLDTPILAYSDAIPPRFYKLYENTQFGKYWYYPSWSCAPYNESVCEKTYTVYRCTLENTACAQLPFEYSGEYVSDIAMSQDEKTQEINIYFWIGHYPGVNTLIFTYGNNSRCHIAGCRLLANGISP